MKKIIVIIILFSTSIIAFSQNTDANKILIHKFYDAFNKRDFNFFYSCFADSFLVHFSMNKSFMITPSDVKEDIDLQVKALPDSFDTIMNTVAEGEWVTICVRHTGTFKDSLWGLPPNEKYIDYQVIEMYRIVKNKITEIYVVGDRLSMFQQMGIIPEKIKGPLKN